MSAPDPRLRVEDFDYDLPPELIAQVPLEDRAASRLMVVDRGDGTISVRSIRDLPQLLRGGDLVVVNNTRVMSGRLRGRRATGARVEFLLLRRMEDGWLTLAKPAGRLRVGERIGLESSSYPADEDESAEILERGEEGMLRIRLSPAAEANLNMLGDVPLPPYIHARLNDADRYQTVYSSEPGSAAAPTAGLHLTTELIEGLLHAGIGFATVTLHVGLDTFRPVTVERVVDHRIHREWCEVTPETGRAVAETHRRGGRVVAVGTTTARTLETLGRETEGNVDAGWSGWTDIFITPGYRWTVCDGLLTNFHLPRSTLLMMVSSFAGSELVRRSYDMAISEGFRFFSFGDAQLFL